MKSIMEQIQTVFGDNQEQIKPDYLRDMDEVIETFFEQLDSYRRDHDKEIPTDA